ncbi:hypothetical protein HMPREF1214_02532 [Bacteroides sp. HPS0048]|nr:hypothetical protein HMPREF1214_02532 [Bacteroides sp. HPS0048]
MKSIFIYQMTKEQRQRYNSLLSLVNSMENFKKRSFLRGMCLDDNGNIRYSSSCYDYTA